MKHYKISTSIKATPQTIWSILTDSSHYPDWNESVTKVEGTIALGQTIKVFAKVSPDRAFPVKVVELTSAKQMVWQGGMPLGLFKGVRTFSLTPQDNGEVRFTMEEQFSGLLSGLICKSMPDLTESFEQFANGLKAHAEQQN